MAKVMQTRAQIDERRDHDVYGGGGGGGRGGPRKVGLASLGLSSASKKKGGGGKLTDCVFCLSLAQLDLSTTQKKAGKKNPDAWIARADFSFVPAALLKASFWPVQPRLKQEGKELSNTKSLVAFSVTDFTFSARQI